MQPEQLGPLSGQIPLPSLTIKSNLSCLTSGDSNFPQPDEKDVKVHQDHAFHISAIWKIKKKTFIKQFEPLSIVYLPFS